VKEEEKTTASVIKILCHRNQALAGNLE